MCDPPTCGGPAHLIMTIGGRFMIMEKKLLMKLESKRRDYLSLVDEYADLEAKALKSGNVGAYEAHKETKERYVSIVDAIGEVIWRVMDLEYPNDL